jgi:Mitochondrial carrier protein
MCLEFAQVYANGGLRGFYRGFVAAIVQFAPTSALWWSAYGVYKVSFYVTLLALHTSIKYSLYSTDHMRLYMSSSELCMS